MQRSARPAPGQGRWLLATLAAVALAALAAPPAASAAQGRQGACPAAATVPASAASAGRSARSLLCLMNRERARAGVRQLRLNRCLGRAAGEHARDMVRRRYFAHRSRDGRDFDDRILATGYAPRPERWTVGENLAWGAAPAGDPAWVLRAWLNSPGHRENLLNAAYRDVGVAAIPGAPIALGADPPARATYAVEFGVHSGSGGGCR
jgi:uncharacterized protein YkwD